MTQAKVEVCSGSSGLPSRKAQHADTLEMACDKTLLRYQNQDGITKCWGEISRREGKRKE
jgi:hypothetical protein